MRRGRMMRLPRIALLPPRQTRAPLRLREAAVSNVATQCRRTKTSADGKLRRAFEPVSQRVKEATETDARLKPVILAAAKAGKLRGHVPDEVKIAAGASRKLRARADLDN